MIQTILKGLGLPVKIRSFMVDYVDAKGNYFNKPLQIVVPSPDANQTDQEILAAVRADIGSQYTVYSVMEAEGDYSMNELPEIFCKPENVGKVIRVLFFDPVTAFKDRVRG